MKIANNWMAAAAGAALMLCPAPASAADGPYVAIRGGPAQAQAYRADVGAAPAAVSALQESYRIGYEADLAAGYELGPLRFEVEGSQKGTRLSSAFAASTATIPNSATNAAGKGAGTFSAPTGKLRVRSAMLNAYVSTTNRDVFASGNLHFYAGAGVGHAWARAFNHRAITGAPAFLNGGAKSFAWQLMIGARYDLTSRLSLDAGYKYFSATRLRFTDYAQRRVAGSHSWNGFLVGASYSF